MTCTTKPCGRSRRRRPSCTCTRSRERRTFLKRSGLAAVGGTLLATGGGIATFTRLGGLAAAQEPERHAIAGYAQSIELAAVAAYTAAAPKLSGDVLDVATLFAGHHQEHADAFGAVAGDDARPEANAKLVEAVTPTLEAVGAADAERRAHRPDPRLRPGPREPGGLHLRRRAHAAAATRPTPRPRRRSCPIEAQHATVLTLALEGGPDELFPTGAFESAALGDGTDPTKGLDPAVFG